MANYQSLDSGIVRKIGRLCFLLCFLGMTRLGHGADWQQIVAFGNMSINAQTFPTIENHLNHVTEISDAPLVILFVGGFLDGDSCNIKLLKAIHKFSDKIYLIPGSKEWETLGPAGVADLDDLLKEAFENDVFIPDNACGEIESKSIDDDIELLAIDSKWYLQDWENQIDLNKNCEIQSRDQFLFELADEVMSNKEKSLILTMYHPPARFDKKSGNQKFIHHIFPFASENNFLYLPLPLLGTYFLQAQSFLRSHEYAPHPRYRTLTRQIENLAEDHQRLMVISSDGMHSSVVEHENCNFINVNSNAEINSFNVDAPSKFTDEPAVLYVTSSKQEYRYELRALSQPQLTLISGHKELPEIVSDEVSEDSLNSTFPSTYTTTIYEPENFTHLGADWFTGKLNTALYALPIEVPTLNLKAGKDLNPIKIGGGQQTISVRLKNEQDQQFVIRSLQKRPTKLLSRKLRISFIENFIEYYFTSAHPFAFLAVPVLEEALGLYHTNPTVYYVPTQKQLAPYNDEIGNQLVLFRERADDDWESSKSLGRSTKIISTSDMKEDLLKNKLQVNAKYYLKNRLMDLTLGDWDRHSDQWRWARDQNHKNQELEVYYPVGRDRDQAMSNFDGALIKLLRFYDPSFKPMRSFDDEITRSDIRWQGFSASSLDHIILSTLDKAEWEKASHEMQSNLSKEIIAEAIDQMPKEISAEDKLIWTNTLWTRFDALDQTATYFYEEFHKNPVIYASNDTDSIFIHFNTKDTGRITIKSKKDDEDWITKMDRTFVYKDVNILRIHALEGDDKLIINKTVRKPKIILLGGYGTDEYLNLDNHHPKNIQIIEQGEEDQKINFPKLNISTSDQKNIDEIPRRAPLPNYSSLNPTFQINRDDGVFIGVSGRYHVNRFQKEIIHFGKVTFATARKSSQIQYGLQVYNALRKSITFLDVNLDGPRYESNFYGMGNESTYDQELPKSFYFLRRQLQTIKTGLIWSLGSLGRLSSGIYGERITLEQIEDRYINEFIADKCMRGPNHFAGLYLNLDISNFNSSLKVTDGVKLGFNITAKKGLDNQKNQILINPYYHLYKGIGSNKRLIYSTKIQYHGIIGDYFFFQGPTIGGSDYLRGYRRERFRGRSTFAHNNNLHIKIIDRLSAKYFPAGIGLTASFDYGRVWLEDEDSKKWHSNWGLGLWISPLNAFIVSGSIYKSLESTEVRVKLGWQF